MTELTAEQQAALDDAQAQIDAVNQRKPRRRQSLPPTDANRCRGIIGYGSMEKSEMRDTRKGQRYRIEMAIHQEGMKEAQTRNKNRRRGKAERTHKARARRKANHAPLRTHR